MFNGYSIHAFIDGAYLRSVGDVSGTRFPEPYHLCVEVMSYGLTRYQFLGGAAWEIHRVNFYDAAPKDAEPTSELSAYWDAIELSPNVRMGWGFLRRESRKRTQKGVDVLLTTEMLAGAVDGSYEVALLVAGDGDFVPVLEEIRRRGKRVLLVARSRGLPGLSDELRRSCDFFVDIDSDPTWLRAVAMLPPSKGVP